jgi:hypothetical protein
MNSSYMSRLESLELDNSATTIQVSTKSSESLNDGEELRVDATRAPTEAQPEVPDQLPAEPGHLSPTVIICSRT